MSELIISPMPLPRGPMRGDEVTRAGLCSMLVRSLRYAVSDARDRLSEDEAEELLAQLVEAQDDDPIWNRVTKAQSVIRRQVKRYREMQ